MTSAALLLGEVRSAGAELFVEEGRLRIRSPELVSPELRSRLRAHRADLTQLLEAGDRDQREPAAPAELVRRPDVSPAGPRECTEDCAVGLPPLEEQCYRLAVEAEEREDDLLEVLPGSTPMRGGVEPLWILPEGADPANPPPGWVYVTRGRLTGCWVAGDGTVAPSEAPSPQAPSQPRPVLHPSPRTSCWSCRGSRWWRPGRGAPWVCSRCHPPLLGIGPVQHWPTVEPDPTGVRRG